MAGAARRNAIRTVFWLLLAATVALYLAMVLWSLPIVSADAGGLPPFDPRPPGYATGEARGFLAALGETGLAQYQGPQRRLDTVYPLFLAATLILAAWRIFRRRPVAVAVSALAAPGAVFDLREKAPGAGLLGPGAPGAGGKAAAALPAILKSAMTALVVGILMLAVGLALWRRRRA